VCGKQNHHTSVSAACACPEQPGRGPVRGRVRTMVELICAESASGVPKTRSGWVKQRKGYFPRGGVIQFVTIIVRCRVRALPDRGEACAAATGIPPYPGRGPARPPVRVLVVLQLTLATSTSKVPWINMRELRAVESRKHQWLLGQSLDRLSQDNRAWIDLNRVYDPGGGDPIYQDVPG